MNTELVQLVKSCSERGLIKFPGRPPDAYEDERRRKRRDYMRKVRAADPGRWNNTQHQRDWYERNRKKSNVA